MNSTIVLSSSSSSLRLRQSKSVKPMMGTWFAAAIIVFALFVTVDAAISHDMSFASLGQHSAIRRLDCSVFCRKTGFSGYVGGCQCGFTLFARKRNRLLPIFRSPIANRFTEPFEANGTNDDETIEETEYGSVGKNRQTGSNRAGQK